LGDRLRFPQLVNRAKSDDRGTAGSLLGLLPAGEELRPVLIRKENSLEFFPIYAKNEVFKEKI